MEQEKSILPKIGAGVLSALIVAGIAYGAYYFIKKSPAIGKLANLFAPGPLRGPESSTRAEDLDADEIIRWTNYYRSEDNIASLSKNAKLTSAASEKANDLFEKQYFEHVSPTGESAADLVIAEGYNYRVVGENLALGDFKSEKELVDAWMDSPGHRENILKKDYEEIGVASKLSEFEGRMTWISVQIFATSAPECVTPDQSLKNTLDAKQAEYNSLGTQIQNLYDQGNSLIDQGNAKIKQGNQIYKETRDRSQAQPYWDEGERLQSEGEAKRNQADSLMSSYNSLGAEIQNLISDYNAQVNKYNSCIQ